MSKELSPHVTPTSSWPGKSGEHATVEFPVNYNLIDMNSAPFRSFSFLIFNTFEMVWTMIKTWLH